jgi:hypothetical protein
MPSLHKETLARLRELDKWLTPHQAYEMAVDDIVYKIADELMFRAVQELQETRCTKPDASVASVPIRSVVAPQ